MRKKQKLVFIIIGFHWLSTAIETQIQNCNNDDVIWLKTPYSKNLFRTIAIIVLLLGTLLKLINGSGRNSLNMYEKAYANELGYAFKNKPFQRKKLLCACRLYNESNYRKAR